jgi:acyl-CoA synthetase (AMP-forming)/AMP-acid ligase II
MPEATASGIDDDGWLHTGDLGTIDERGYCKIQGRLKDMIIRGGENIYPREIEAVLYEHPAADAGMQPHPVVFAPHPGEFGVEHGGVVDVIEVRPVGLDVSQEALHLGLVGGRVRAPVVLPDGDQGHELAGVAGGHLGSPVRPGDQDRPPGSSRGRSRRSGVSSSMSPWPSSAYAKASCTWVVVSSG